MAMTTRFRSKKQEINNEIKLDPKMPTTKQPFGEIEKRRALGDICGNRIGADKNNGNEKDKKSGTVYKDIKPRVDTRWKKSDNPALLKRTTSTSSVAVPRLPVVPRQASKHDVLRKASTDNTTVQIKKPTSQTTVIDIKKEPIEGQTYMQSVVYGATDLQLIRSPGLKLKREKIENVQRNYYESHSSKLLHQIDNIDEKDRQNPQLLSEYVNDIYSYLFKLEDQFPIAENFLSQQMDVTPKMRSVLLDWINEVHSQFSLELETFHMAVSMIDRYMQSVTSTSRRFLQLVGVTSLFMASKYEELMPPDIGDFVYVTDDTYNKEQILQMEKNIFKSLGFHLGKPLSIHFLRRFAKAAGTLGDRHYLAAKYFLELASIDYELTKYRPSEIAASSLYLSLYIMNKIKSDNDLWTPTLEHYSTYTVQHLMPVVKRIATIVTSAKDMKLKSVYTKYSHAHCKFTSTIPEMTGTKIYGIINRN